MKQWYEDLFLNYGLKYDQECFVKGKIFFHRHQNPETPPILAIPLT